MITPTTTLPNVVIEKIGHSLTLLTATFAKHTYSVETSLGTHLRVALETDHMSEVLPLSG